MASSLRSREGAWIVALAVLAALRVAVFAAAFPFFTNVDEHRHVDAVLKYAHGYLPTPENRAYEPEMARYLGIYASPEYQGAPGERGLFLAPPPPWQRPAAAMLGSIEKAESFLARRSNLESSQPPAYYLVGAAWLRVGMALGIEGGQLLYWLRGLSALIVLALVLTSYHFLCEIHPEEPFVRLGVPVLLAVFPMDAFFYVTRDALSPLVAGVGFFLALRLLRQPAPGWAASLGLGALLAVAFLAKYTNLALLVVALACTAIAWSRRYAARAKLLAVWAVVGLIAGAWLLRNLLVFGDVTATAYKIERMRWARAPIASTFDHPLFTFEGVRTFIGDLVPLYWRGELAWHRAPLASAFADDVYLWTSLLFVVLAAVGLRRLERPAIARISEALALVSVAASVAILAVLSLLYVFHETSNPSAAHPYFVQGRLISGSLVPFCLIYVRGIEVATSCLPGRVSRASAWGILGLVVAVVLLSEVALHRSVFASGYNLFRLP